MDMTLDSRTIGGLVMALVAAAILIIAWTKPSPTPKNTDQLVGKWFQSYDLIPFEDRTEDSGKWEVGKTGWVVSLMEAGLYLIDYDDDTGQVTIGVKHFHRWRFFPTEAALLKFVEGQD